VKSNNIAAMKKRKNVYIHLLIWAIWYFMVCFWAIYAWVKVPFWPTFYNLSSLIVVFYSVRWIAGIYWKKIEKETGMFVSNEKISIRLPSFRLYAFQWPVFALLSLIFLYIVSCWMIESFFENHGLQPIYNREFWKYTYNKWTTESVYVLGGNVMAAIEYLLRKEKERLRILEEYFQENYDRTMEYERKIKDYLDVVNEQDKRRRKKDNDTGKQ
jgi:hypothetical protein